MISSVIAATPKYLRIFAAIHFGLAALGPIFLQLFFFFFIAEAGRYEPMWFTALSIVVLAAQYPLLPFLIPAAQDLIASFGAGLVVRVVFALLNTLTVTLVLYAIYRAQRLLTIRD